MVTANMTPALFSLLERGEQIDVLAPVTLERVATMEVRDGCWWVIWEPTEEIKSTVYEAFGSREAAEKGIAALLALQAMICD